MVNPFRRYTNLAATIHLLRSKELALLNPATWDDKNDAYYMAEYKRLKNAKTVLALCFAEASETYHHWRVFSHGSDGVCLEFDKDRVLTAFEKDSRIRTDYMDYQLIKDLNAKKSVDVEELPFLKRKPYEDECEFRIVYVDTKNAAELKSYAIKISWIRRVTLSPWMSRALSESVKETLRSIEGCSKVKVARSTLVENESWKRITARAH